MRTMLYFKRVIRYASKGVGMQRVPWYKNICWPIASFIVPAHVIAAVGTYFYAVHHGFTLSAIVIGVVFLFLTTFSISGGYHRLFAHATYEAPMTFGVFPRRCAAE